MLNWFAVTVAASEDSGAGYDGDIEASLSTQATLFLTKWY